MSDLQKFNEGISDSLLQNQPELQKMLEAIKKSMPELLRSRKNFGKTQSQFMDNMLTVSHPTPLRNMQQILAEVERIVGALKDAHFDIKKKKIEIQIKLRDAKTKESEGLALEAELLRVESDEIASGIEQGEIYISGAIRKLANYSEQYNLLAEKIMKEQGVVEFSEVDFEREEEKYHIMKAFEQGLCAARSRGGIVDEGNHIYFYQIGVNGSMAQAEVLRFLQLEAKLLETNRVPPHSLVVEFLEQMAEKFKGCSEEFAKAKGFKVKSDLAMVEPKLLNLRSEE